MPSTLKLLLVEDSEDDEQLVLLELRRSGYHVTHRRVETSEAMRQALADEEWDLVLSDYSMPRFDAPAALQVLKESGKDLPFIIASGTVGEETAVAALHAGAHDFLVKSRLARLAPAIERSLRDAQARRAQREAEEEVARLEEAVHHAQKMEAIGRLAGGVAHDFNNVLTAIIATADLAMDAPGLPAEVKADLETIRDAGRRAAGITRQLLTFSRKQVVQPRSLDVNDVIQRAEPLLRRVIAPEISVATDLGARSSIEADPTQIEQVLINLVVNASDAMPDGGTISLRTADVTTQDGRLNGQKVPPGQYVMLSVSDTGMGMDADTLARIFEPFFTTKDPGKGTGLGLATVYGIVRQSGGHVAVESRPGEGTRFDICFPALDERLTYTTSETAAARDLSGSEVVLVVEDEASVRAPLSRALRQLGYLVLEAEHGEDALSVMQEYHAPVHLLISDVVMPEMNGATLVRMLRDWFPHLKVIFISGYSEELLAAEGPIVPGALYLQKPFSATRLAEAVRELLDAPLA